MKILYDHQIFSSQTFGGVSRYHCALIKEFARNHLLDWELPLYFSNNEYLAKLFNVTKFFPDCQFRGKNWILERLNRQKVISVLKRGDFEVFHPTFYLSYFLPYLNRPLVITVHDMIHDLHPELPAHQWEVREKGKLIKAANQIIVPSIATANDLMRIADISSAKISVIPHGAPDSLSYSSRQLNYCENEFLFVGARSYYKNFDVVLRALKSAANVKLRCIGGNFTAEEMRRIDELGLNERVRQETVHSDNQLASIYAQSAGLIFPSLCEGFGLPILEAFSASCPVVLSDIPVFREIAGNSAVYFDPHDEADLSKKLLEVKLRRQELITNGAERVKNFTWEKCAALTLKVYQEAIR